MSDAINLPPRRKPPPARHDSDANPSPDRHGAAADASPRPRPAELHTSAPSAPPNARNIGILSAAQHQLRELLAYAKVAAILGENAAIANLAGIAPEEDRDAVAEAVGKAFGRKPPAPLALGRQL